VNFRRIVYATDATMAPDDAAAYALSLAQEYGAQLTIIHAIREMPDIWSGTHDQVREDYLCGLRQLVPTEVESWCEPEFVIRFGEPAAEILDVANGRKADIIVMGVHGGIALAGHRPATVAYKIVCEAHCPVLTVRGEANP
jgi:nucleotide-binding universal stress UspA family protein